MVATPADSDWRTAASCREADPELFFSDQPAAALATCARCPVVDACLQDALTNARLYGVWGGRTETERRAMLGMGPRRRPKQETGVRVDCGCGSADCPGQVSPRTRRVHRKAAGLPSVLSDQPSTSRPVDCRCGLSSCPGRVARQTRLNHRRRAAELARTAVA
jgi:WhiB family redox-sensing transcriptional regulator